MATGLVQFAPRLIGLLVQLISALTAIILMERRLAYIMIIGGLLLFIFPYSFRRILKRLYKAVREADGILRVFFRSDWAASCLLSVPLPKRRRRPVRQTS